MAATRSENYQKSGRCLMIKGESLYGPLMLLGWCQPHAAWMSVDFADKQWTGKRHLAGSQRAFAYLNDIANREQSAVHASLHVESAASTRASASMSAHYQGKFIVSRWFIALASPYSGFRCVVIDWLSRKEPRRSSLSLEREFVTKNSAEWWTLSAFYFFGP